MNIQASKFILGNRAGAFPIARKRGNAFAKTASFKKKEWIEAGILDEKVKEKVEEKTEELKKMEEVLRSAKESMNSLTGAEQKILLKKIACGEELTEKEKNFLPNLEPQSLKKAQLAARRRRELESRLARAKSRAEAKAILMSAKQEVQMAFSAGKNSDGNEYAGYLSAAVNKAEERYYRNELKKKSELDIKV